MDILLMLLAFGLFLAFVLGMLKPSIVIKSNQPSRKKVMLYYLLPSIVAFIGFTMLTDAQDSENWAHPESATDLRLTNDDLNAMPEKLKEFKKVVSLNLFNNNISVLDEDILRSMTALKTLKVKSNPISEIPDWLGELGLEQLDISGTNVSTLSDVLRASIAEIEYADTPLYEAEEMAKKQKVQAQDESGEAEQKTESLVQYATRSLLSKDYGSNKAFKSAHIYYTANIADELVDKLGLYMIDQGYFTDDRPMDVQLTYKEGDVNAYILKMVYTLEALDNESKLLFQLLGIGIMDKVLDGKPLQIHLTDEEFETQIVVEMK